MSTLADRAIAALRTTHDGLAAFVRGLDSADLDRQSGASEWTVAQVLSHLGSGAEIGLATLRAALDGQEAPGQDFNHEVWDRWNAKDPEGQCKDFLVADAEIVSAYEGLDAGSRERLRIKLGFLPEPGDVALVAGMRLNEAALHAWDVRVAFDPAATVASETGGVLTDLYSGPLDFMIGFIGRSDALDDPRRATTLRVETTDPARVLGLTLGETVGFSEAPEAADVTLSLPAEAWVRLLGGRLAGEHTPASVAVTGDGITLDDLRRVFPGI
ncbi:maleylpyruvate isomerase N-terminal domain-containing protein [Streptosporangium sp. NBC_01810]|uniref:maleylpyruvate isomerase N-terminal domain-containing protein n=1 Tax=Streptosporangium sp. NBC_01810 TaxID=2975951 RepID=UPI002DDB46EC|nr:maleylpyruvate isomerase N-terminal domain-containing protein [Streptosporangium sp. NBC_01810]WSA22789.1 maleylpyruvate isomerase N-terminal domain-containing protein [Streptosporangium sp. NBC_01810]